MYEYVLYDGDAMVAGCSFPVVHHTAHVWWGCSTIIIIIIIIIYIRRLFLLLLLLLQLVLLQVAHNSQPDGWMIGWTLKARIIHPPTSGYYCTLP